MSRRIARESQLMAMEGQRGTEGGGVGAEEGEINPTD
jgi:hypothetical protein